MKFKSNNTICTILSTSRPSRAADRVSGLNDVSLSFSFQIRLCIKMFIVLIFP